ncbi:hypothetical protein D3C75_787720 [compost metagenome]
MHKATQELKIITLACLLKEIGFDEKKVDELILKYAQSLGVILKIVRDEDLLSNALDYLSRPLE